MTDQVTYFQANVAVDDRGMLQFCNDFDMSAVKRFYVVSNHQSQFVRAWHAHKIERKFAYVVSGSALFCIVQIDDWEKPDPNLQVQRQTLSYAQPGVLEIPGGFAHGFKTLVPDTKVIFFSSSTLQESAEDDFRYPYDYWNPWSIVPR
ncbi:MAG: sugar epimerase [Rhodospirillaceae bacterium]|nr:sugar epimerase [Rhodospirillaceae bacterium]